MSDEQYLDEVNCCYVYVLGSFAVNGVRTYVGWTTNLERRLAEHNSGRGARATRGREWRLLYSERAEDRGLAQSREYALKKNRSFRKMLAVHIPGTD